MDLNIAITDNNRENNQLLLNAIKNKFAAQTASEAAAFSPPKFNIPILKIPGNGASLENSPTNGNQNDNQSPSNQLNQFLLKQLQDKQANNGGIKQQHIGFVLPQFQTSSESNKNAVKFELPVRKPHINTTTVSSLTSAINKLQVEEQHHTTTSPSIPSIDLTTALASKLQTHQGTPPTRDLAKPVTKHQQANDLDFDIPFIDCDRLDNTRSKAVLLNTSNEYCVTDISQISLKHSFAEPSTIGSFLCLEDNKYLAPVPLKCTSRAYRQQKVKHFIEPFRFETKSPDDLVLEALNKYQRRHYN